MVQPSLTEIFLSHTGKVADKWEQYLPIYTAELDIFRRSGKPVHLLEVGVQNGGSLEVWSKFLPEGSCVTGLDIDEKVAALSFESPFIQVKIVDATKKSELDAAIRDQMFDIIIDDGSHRSEDIIATFQFLFDHLNLSGKYFIEDLHCSYFAGHGGGFNVPTSSLAWLRGLVDGLHQDHFAADESVPIVVRTALKHYNKLLKRITFYDSMAVVEKLSAEKVESYRRVLAGHEMPVVTFQSWIPQASTSSLRDLLLNSEAAKAMDATLATLLEQSRAEQAESKQKMDHIFAELKILRDKLDYLAEVLRQQ